MTNTISFVTIASTGNATDFGDLNVVRNGNRAASSSTRALFGGGFNNAYLTEVEYVQIATTGNSSNFGNLTIAVRNLGACSNCHGGL